MQKDTSSKSDLNSVAYSMVTGINIWGRKKAMRLMEVYRTVGCSYDKDGKGCTMCNFGYYAENEIKDDNILKRHAQVLTHLEGAKYQHFALLTLGNFFNDKEISPQLRLNLLKPLSKIKWLERVLVESRSQYINEEKLLIARQCLRNDQILEFAFGYESQSEHIRNKVLKKGTTEEDLDRTMSLCRKVGIDFVSYVLIKPHTLTEAEGITDAVETALHVLHKAQSYKLRARIEFEPTFVTHGKIIETMFNEGKYTPPKLWSVIEVIKKTVVGLGKDFKAGSLFVGLSDENLSDGRSTSNCGNCDDEVRQAIRNFNSIQDLEVFSHLSCDCKKEWENIVNHSLPKIIGV